MKLWNDISNQVYEEGRMPETGSVLDNKDGSYVVSYRITRAGMYQHVVSIDRVVGAGTPVFLSVTCDIADISRTYVYGELLKLETGKASTVYVQTRDRFGNNMRFTDDEKNPCTGYPLSETCNQIIDYQMCAADEFQEPCRPENIESNFGKSLKYQMGPTGSTTDANGEPYYGLYEITIYPFKAASFLPMVYHNESYVACYFDTGDLMGSAEADPGWLLANFCAENNNAQSSVASRRGSGSQTAVEPMGVIRVSDRIALATKYNEARSQFGVSIPVISF